MKIDYKNVKEFPGWDLAPEFLRNIISQYDVKNILEIGSGANPTLTLDYIKSKKLMYTTNDIDSGELKKADPFLKTLCFDFCNPEIPEDSKSKYDLIFSRMVNEHVRDGRQYYKNIYEALVDDGITVHCFSTLYSLPFVVNKVTPEWLSSMLLRVFAPRDEYSHGKFKAYYSWSRGPANKMINRFQDIGFEVVEYVGFFGHDYYKKRLPVLDYFEQIKTNHLLTRFKSPYLTSYAYVILKKTRAGSDKV